MNLRQTSSNQGGSGTATVQFGDSGNIDAFSRLRVSSPNQVWDGQFTYSLLTALFEPLTNGAGSSVTHDTTNRCAQMNLAASPNGSYAYLQTFDYFRYQPGRSQIIFATFNFVDNATNSFKFIGYSDGANGIELQRAGGVSRLAILSSTSNGNQFVNQSAWNLDKMDGTGPSGIIIDWTKSQILVIDLQALYVGRVRVGFDIGGLVYYVHQFVHSNLIATTYIQTANLPIRAGMSCTGACTSTMRFYCSSVMSEGGDEEIVGYAFTAPGVVTANNGTRTHILSVRPKTTFRTFQNRIKFQLDAVDMIITGNFPIYWELCIGQALTGPAWADANTTYSGFEYAAGATLSGTPAIVIHSGYAASAGAVKESINRLMSQRYPITLDAAGNNRDLGTLTLLATGIGGATAMRAAMNWREIR